MDQKHDLLKQDWEGKGPFDRIAKWMNQVGAMINNLHYQAGGDIISTKDFIRLRPVEPAQFSGIVYAGGVKHTGKNSDGAKPWIAVDVSAGTVTEETGPPPAPFPDGVEYYEKAATYGDIHCPVF